MFPKTRKDNKMLRRLLTEGPIPATGVKISGELRTYTRVLDLYTNRSRIVNGEVTPVLYLIGDERKAIRLFIMLNYEACQAIVSDSLSGANIVSTQWDTRLYDLFKQEYYWINQFELE